MPYKLLAESRAINPDTRAVRTIQVIRSPEGYPPAIPPYRVSYVEGNDIQTVRFDTIRKAFDELGKQVVALVCEGYAFDLGGAGD